MVSTGVSVRAQQRPAVQQVRQQQLRPSAVKHSSSLGWRSSLPTAHRRTPLLTAAVAEEPVSVDDGEFDTNSLYQEFELLLAQHDHNFKRGDLVTGTVVTSDERGAYVDFGAKTVGFCSSAEASICQGAKAKHVLIPESQREFLIIRDNSRDGMIQLSLREMEYALVWQRLRQMQAEDVAIMATVLSVNRGGLMVEVEHLRGFVPASHLSMRITPENILGERILVKLLEVDEERQRLVLSNRKAESRASDQDFKVGDVVEGTVEAVKPYGAFINLGSTNGLLHVSQISHERVTNVEAVLSIGDKLKVMILSQDADKTRIALSTRKLEPSPGDMVRDPALVYEKADEMAATFRARVAEVEAAARQEEQNLAGSPEPMQEA
uniref:Small subunit ribosomal protein S1 n=1 Tax=Tetraselmis sp. GSL018 TaxID=582737 RepID=A0A061RP50_9CHLO|eukprot:CAMPEP_0177627192 /NCGR_PEP_ID=MMETSP0419_2-20121207/31069_1 /TAXON_ID=582737 /ORGANISM="Tetraselmis sp., Strain GSL018" /LENGTH=378 /DNA_ID=CAMNT_0019128323 /DNA_START=69 /DNA_END=1205 /DNA_ORIENTATION=-